MRKRHPPTAYCVGATTFFCLQKCSQDWSKLNRRSLFQIFAPKAYNWTLSKKVSIFLAKLKIENQCPLRPFLGK